MIEEKDNLSKFGTSFQTKTLASLISDKRFMERMVDILDPDYYDSNANQWICQKLKEYWAEYRDTASLDYFKTELSKQDDKEFQSVVIQSLRKIYKNLDANDLQYVKDEFLEFAKNQAMKVAIVESVDLMKVGDYDQIRSRVDDALNAGMDKNVGHIYTRDFEERIKKSARDTVPTPWEIINEVMDGGLGNGELGSFVGASGAGKTWLLCALGMAALKEGKMVAHYTLELSEDQTGLRYDSILGGINPTDVRHNKDKIKPLVKELKEGGGELAIQEWPARSVSTSSLRGHVGRMETLHRKPDLILVDYADLLKAASGKSYDGNSYQRAGQIYIELRALASELEVPIWTVSQANREGNSADVIGAEMIADSYQKVMHSDFIASLSRTSDDKEQNTARIHLMKNRFGPDGMTYPAHIDTEHGKIEVFEKNTDKANEMIRDMQRQRQKNKNEKISRLADEFLESGKLTEQKEMDW
jgi:replicative DNA helicase